MSTAVQVFKKDGRQHWDVLRGGSLVGFISRIGNARTAVRFVAVVDNCYLNADPAAGVVGFGSLSEARRAVTRRERRR